MELPSENPSDKIEVTPEMIEAGVRCYLRHPCSWEPSEEEMGLLVRDIFRAMACKACLGATTHLASAS
jgi:hypothetical protein